MPVTTPISVPPPIVYNYQTLAQMRQELANRLYDSGQVFWSPLELNQYIYESLRTWNALTNFWRFDFQFTPLQGNTWYDLTDNFNLPYTIRPYTVTDWNLYTVMQYQLLEQAPVLPATPLSPYVGSAQFTADDFTNAMQRRRDEILSMTGCTVTRRNIGAVAGRITLPDTVIDIRRMAYFPAVGSPSQMWPEDTWGEMSFNVGYTTAPAGAPLNYLQTTQQPISFDTNCPPNAAGQYELLTIEAGVPLTPPVPNLLQIPDDWTHVLKWGAMADLLSRESNAKDSLRATYCNQRYKMGLKLLNGASALLALRIGNLPVQIDSVRAADEYQVNWQALAPGSPSSCYYTGLNLFALSPAPSNNTFGAVATVVENAPMPTGDASPMQMARDIYDVILDYAQHLASFKMGGADFTSTMPLFERFVDEASNYGLKLSEIAEYTSVIYGLATLEKSMNPITAPEPTSAS